MTNYLNDDQRAHMEWLAKQPPENLCPCGWATLDELKRGANSCSCKAPPPSENGGT